MKKTFIFLLFIPVVLFSQNRIATKNDIKLYGNYITVGDLIIDTPTERFPDGINRLAYMKISAKFPDLRENAVIWVDGDKLGAYCEFRLLNGKETSPWSISNATLKPIPGTRMNGIYTSNSHGGFLHLIQGLKNFKIDGGSDPKYPGLSSFPKDRLFLKGSFGIGATSTGIYKGYHVYSISVLDSGSIYISGIEGEHGFSVLRLQGGKYDWTVSVTIENCYIHDSNSEGMYIGFTHALPGAKIKDLQIRNVIFARTGSESLQMQHLVGNCKVSNITIYAPDAGYLKQFMGGQDTAIQLNVDQGETVIENIVVDSWGSHAINIFGSDAVVAGANDKTVVRNILFNDGRGQAIYPHQSCKYGINWNFENLYIRGSNNDYFINSKVEKPDYAVCANEGTDMITFRNIKHDGSLRKVFQSDVNIETGTIQEEELPPIEYVNSGFYEPASKIKVWHQFYARYLTGTSNIPTKWEVGDIAQDMEEGFLPVFCKCIIAHNATDIRPKNSQNYTVLSWDENGVRNDQPNWNKKDMQKPYPPDDLRVKERSYYGHLGIGFVEN